MVFQPGEFWQVDFGAPQMARGKIHPIWEDELWRTFIQDASLFKRRKDVTGAGWGWVDVNVV